MNLLVVVNLEFVAVLNVLLILRLLLFLLFVQCFFKLTNNVLLLGGFFKYLVIAFIPLL